MLFDAAKFGLENGKVPPGMIRLIIGRDPPQIVPFVSELFCFAHNFKVQEVRRHYFPVNVARTAVKICGSRTKTDYERRRKQHAAILRKKKRTFSKRRKQGYQRFKIIRWLRGNSLPFAGLFVNFLKVGEALRGGVLHHRNTVPSRDADVISALGLHLREKFGLGQTQVHTARVSGFHKKIGAWPNGAESSYEIGENFPARFHAHVTDDALFGLASLFNRGKHRVKHRLRQRRIGGEYRAVLDVVEPTAGLVQESLRHGAADDQI